MPTYNLTADDKQRVVDSVTAAQSEAREENRAQYDSILTELNGAQVDNGTYGVQFNDAQKELIVAALSERGRMTAMAGDDDDAAALDALARRVRRASGGRRRKTRKNRKSRKARKSRRAH